MFRFIFIDAQINLILIPRNQQLFLKWIHLPIFLINYLFHKIFKHNNTDHNLHESKVKSLNCLLSPANSQKNEKHDDTLLFTASLRRQFDVNW